MKFNKDTSGKYYTATNLDAITYKWREDGRFAGTGAMTDLGENRITVILTGWQVTSKTGCLMSEAINGEWIDISDGWAPTGSTLAYSKNQAQELVNKTIRNNEKILCNNILCARFRDKLSGEQKQMLYDLQTRLVARDNALRDNNLVQVSTIGTPSGYSELEDYLNTFMQSGGVGSISLTTIVIVATVLSAAVATAAYMCYKRYYDESEKDIKYSDELTKILTSKLTDEEYQMLVNETKGIVTRASIRSRLSGGKYFIYGGLALLAGVLLLYCLNKN